MSSILCFWGLVTCLIFIFDNLKLPYRKQILQQTSNIPLVLFPLNLSARTNMKCVEPDMVSGSSIHEKTFMIVLPAEPRHVVCHLQTHQKGIGFKRTLPRETQTSSSPIRVCIVDSMTASNVLPFNRPIRSGTTANLPNPSSLTRAQF